MLLLLLLLMLQTCAALEVTTTISKTLCAAKQTHSSVLLLPLRPLLLLLLPQTCAALEVTAFIVETVCALAGSTGVWAGGSFIASGGVWSAPVELVCLLAQTATG
jgi:hypothetical protein